MPEKFNKNNIDTMIPSHYLESKGIHIAKEVNGEIIAHCPFCDGDLDSRDSEGHFYISEDSGQYYCHKCTAKGNKITLAKHFGDWEEAARTSWARGAGTKANSSHPSVSPNKVAESKPESRTKPVRATSNNNIARGCAKKLSNSVREYLNKRGLNNYTIESAQLGQGNIYSQEWITIPVKGLDGNIDFIKLRCLPRDESKGAKYKNYSVNGSNEAALYGGYDLIKQKTETAIITEGEFDALIAKQNKLPMAVSSTAGAGTFKREWLNCFKHVRELYVCLDNDDKGRAGAEKILDLFKEERPDITLYKTTYPENIKDMTDYFLAGRTAEDLLERHSVYVAGPRPINISELGEMNIDELAEILNSTIKFDEHNKVVLFLAMLTAYTESDQLNIYLNGESSSGKTYLMKEVAKYFPEEDKIILADASPNAFKHQEPTVDSDTGQKYIDLERKLLLFQDVPCYQLQENLRPLLSHDDKEIKYLTTDKNKSQQQVTKESIIRGYPVSVTCSANLRLDEQEKTRSILLSPEVTLQKIEAGKKLANLRSANPVEFENELANNIGRKNLMERIRYVKRLHINSVIIPNPDRTLELFNEVSRKSVSSQQREIAHFNSLIKAVAMLNAHLRLDSNTNDVVANEKDLNATVELWKAISKASALGVPPYLQEFYYTYILPAWKNRQKRAGVSRVEVRKMYYLLNGQSLDENKFRKDIIPALKDASVIEENKDEQDKKSKLIVPLIDADDDLLESDEYNSVEEEIETKTNEEENLLNLGTPIDISEGELPF